MSLEMLVRMKCQMNCRLHGNRTFRLVLIAVGLLVCACAAVTITGCGRGNVNSPTSALGATASAPKAAAAGPAITEKLGFDQLALDSTVKRVKSKQGPTYLQFSYTDRDGKVYKCVLPEAMAEGSYLPDEWIRTFNLYRLPKVIKQKAPPKNPLVGVSDFPFISPRPVPEQTPAEQPAAQQPEMPAPPMPSAPSATPYPSGRGRESDLD